MERLFGTDLVAAEYAVDPVLLRRLKIRAALTMPLHAIALYILNLYCNHRAKNQEQGLDAKWYMATSTKNKIDYNNV